MRVDNTNEMEERFRELEGLEIEISFGCTIESKVEELPGKPWAKSQRIFT